MPGCKPSNVRAADCGSGVGGADSPTDASWTGVRACCRMPDATEHRRGRHRGAFATDGEDGPLCAAARFSGAGGGRYVPFWRKPPAGAPVCMTRPYSSSERTVAHTR